MTLKASYSISGKVEIKIWGKATDSDHVTLARLSQGLCLVKSGHWVLSSPRKFSHVPLIGNILKDYDRQIKLPM